jgi:hypothetical protein
MSQEVDEMPAMPGDPKRKPQRSAEVRLGVKTPATPQKATIRTTITLDVDVVRLLDHDARRMNQSRGERASEILGASLCERKISEDIKRQQDALSRRLSERRRRRRGHVPDDLIGDVASTLDEAAVA